MITQADVILVQIGIILSSLGVLTLSAFDFLEIVELLNIVYCLAELMEFAAFIYLRYKAPSLFRYAQAAADTCIACQAAPLNASMLPLHAIWH